ncbi:metallophosphoesterase [Ectothiorhodospiraceae bacterium WFHF3C12]|nr:metallophosphoesterase [Ectothiorhodospiraceae bacterium WFHF3C12]
MSYAWGSGRPTTARAASADRSGRHRRSQSNGRYTLASPAITERDDEVLLEGLAQRVGTLHLRQRLGIEGEGEQPVVGRGRTRFHPENWVSAHRLIRLLLRLSLLYGWGQRNALDIGLTHNVVRSARLPRAFDGYRLLHLSDLHLDMNARFPHVLAERVRPLEYDACVITGDFRYRTSGSWAACLDGLSRVMPHLRQPVYAVLGNHDSLRMVPELEALGMRVLLNENVTLRRREERIYLVGVDDPHYFRADNLQQAWSGVTDGGYVVLLSHSPEIYRQAAHAGCSLMLSGHTHGGQIRLPGGVPIMTNADCPRYMAAGPWHYAGMRGYTSVGAGSSIVDARFNCRPEVTIHELRAGAGQA